MKKLVLLLLVIFSFTPAVFARSAIIQDGVEAGEQYCPPKGDVGSEAGAEFSSPQNCDIQLPAGQSPFDLVSSAHTADNYLGEDAQERRLTGNGDSDR